MTRCLLGLGSNLGDRQAMLRRATGKVARLPRCRLLARSHWYETVPIGGPTGQGAFLNAALLLQTSLQPQEIATSIHAIESELGRNRVVRWDARAIDIDLLIYGSRVINSPALMVPHPRMSFRRFVLEPVVEIAGGLVHPTSAWTVARLLGHLTSAPRYVAVAAADATLSSWMAERLVRVLGGLRLEDSAPNQLRVGDSKPQRAVEFVRWASASLSRLRWEEDAQLSTRLSTRDQGTSLAVPPVVSGFWYEAASSATAGPTGVERSPAESARARMRSSLTGTRLVRPALVITLQPKSPLDFLATMRSHLQATNLVAPNMSPASLEALLDRRGHGPLASIRADDSTVAMEEAIAAVRSVWPELPAILTE